MTVSCLPDRKYERKKLVIAMQRTKAGDHGTASMTGPQGASNTACGVLKKTLEYDGNNIKCTEENDREDGVFHTSACFARVGVVYRMYPRKTDELHWEGEADGDLPR